ncbi:hypothetical protein D3C84_980750 [compost metagenome]
MINEGVEDLPARGFGTFLTAVVTDWLERASFVLQLEVVPVLAAHEHTGVAVLQFEVMDAFEDLGKGFPLREVLAPVITGR